MGFHVTSCHDGGTDRIGVGLSDGTGDGVNGGVRSAVVGEPVENFVLGAVLGDVVDNSTIVKVGTPDVVIFVGGLLSCELELDEGVEESCREKRI